MSRATMPQYEIQLRTFQFSEQILRLVRSFSKRIEADIIRKQLVRSATSIGANIIEAKHFSSRKEFIQYMQISLRSSREAEYWIKLSISSKICYKTAGENALDECTEISKILSTILVRSKERK